MLPHLLWNSPLEMGSLGVKLGSTEKEKQMNVASAVQCIRVGRKARVALMMHGPGGAGKTSAAKQAAMEISNEEFGTKFTDAQEYWKHCCKLIKNEKLKDSFLFVVLNIPTIDNTDLMGIPVTEQRDNQFITHWARPDFIREDGQGIILFDEVPDGDTLTIKACYSAMLDKRIKDHHFGDGWYITGAGNRPEDKAMARNLPAPLITRMCHVGIGCDSPNFTEQTPENADIDVDEWSVWAFKNSIIPEIIGFLKFRSQLLYNHQATPRTWEFISRIVKAGWDIHGKEITEESSRIAAVIGDMIRGTVGKGPGTEFVSYLRLAQKVPDLELILKKPKTAPVPKDIDIQSAVCTSLVYRTNRDTIEAVMEYSERLEPEISAFTLYSIKNKDVQLLSHPSVTKWLSKHPDMIW